jgi:AbrB family looped-hinge helix DNA binding protein
MSERTAACRLRDRGQLTLPAETRRELGLEAGDYVVIDVEPLGDE